MSIVATRPVCRSIALPSLFTMISTYLYLGVFHLSNTAVSLLFGFLSTFLVVLGRFSDLCKEMAQIFPRTLFSAQNKYSHRFKLRPVAYLAWSSGCWSTPLTSGTTASSVPQ